MNGASFAAGGALAPGSIASIFGDNLADTNDPATVTGIQATSLPLPTTLGGATVRVASTLAQLFYVSRKQINFLVPMEVGDAAQAMVVVLVGPMPSNQPTVSLQPAVPGIFEINAAHLGAVLLANTASLAQPANMFPGSKPVGAGQFVSIFCTGLGAVQDATKPDSQTKVIPKVLVGPGKLPARVDWSGIAPGFVGLNQVNVEIPLTAPIGSAIPITLTVGDDPNAIQSNTVTIAIEAGIVILLDKTEIKVTAPVGGGNPSAATVSVRNDGLPSTVLNPTISVSGTGCTWLTTSPSSLSNLVGGRGAPSPPAPGIVNVNFNVSGVDSGTYTCRINVTDPNAGNSPQTVVVTLTVPPPEMSVDPLSLSMTGTGTGGDPDAKTLTITNTGAGYLSGTVAASVQTPAGGSWLSVSPASYSRLSGSTAAKITVSARAVGLASGTYTGSVTIKGNGVPDKTIPVTLSVGTSVPCTDLTLTSLEFSPLAVGGNPPSRTVKVGNCGAGVLKVNATATTTSGGNWLAVTPASFSGLTGGLSGTTGTLTVSVNVSGMGPNKYTGAITVTDADSPAKVIVSVTLTIMAPSLGVSTNSLTFDAPASGGNPANQMVYAFNLGGGILNVTARVTSGAWLSVSPASLPGLYGTTTGTLTVAASVAGLAAGSYGGSITVSSTDATVTNNPQVINVTLNNRPVIKLSTTSISFNAPASGANPFSYTVTISNAGPGTMSGTVSAGTTTGGNWLSVSPSSFSNLAGSATAPLTVSVNTPGLAAGTYKGTITITAPGAANTPQTISVTLTLTAP